MAVRKGRGLLRRDAHSATVGNYGLRKTHIRQCRSGSLLTQPGTSVTLVGTSLSIDTKSYAN
jgi:hypothetical protein